jgi:hypothetical protein
MVPARYGCAARDLNPNPRIKSPLLCSLILPELLSDNASAYRDLPFCAVARIRAALRIPDNAGPYRGIRANMEQTWIRTGLDHCGQDIGGAVGETVGIVGNGIDAWRGATYHLRSGSGNRCRHA